MSYKYMETEKLSELFEEETNRVLQVLIKNPRLSDEVREKLFTDLRKMAAELSARGK